MLQRACTPSAESRGLVSWRSLPQVAISPVTPADGAKSVECDDSLQSYDGNYCPCISTVLSPPVHFTVSCVLVLMAWTIV